MSKERKAATGRIDLKAAVSVRVHLAVTRSLLLLQNALYIYLSFSSYPYNSVLNNWVLLPFNKIIHLRSEHALHIMVPVAQNKSISGRLLS